MCGIWPEVGWIQLNYSIITLMYFTEDRTITFYLFDRVTICIRTIINNFIVINQEATKCTNMVKHAWANQKSRKLGAFDLKYEKHSSL